MLEYVKFNRAKPKKTKPNKVKFSYAELDYELDKSNKELLKKNEELLRRNP